MARVATGAVGLLLGLYGAWLLLSRQDLDQLVGAAAWLAGGVVLHDFVLAPLVLAAGFVTARLVGRRHRGPLVVGALVVGPLTLLAVPVLGRFGARPDNPTLLDRPYVLGWLVLVGVVAAAVAVAVGVRSRRSAPDRAGG